MSSYYVKTPVVWGVFFCFGHGTGLTEAAVDCSLITIGLSQSKAGLKHLGRL